MAKKNTVKSIENTTLILAGGETLKGIACNGRTGRLNAYKYSFVGRESAAELKKELRELGFEKGELTKEVNRILTGETTLSKVKSEAFDAHCESLGLVRVEGKISSNGKTATTKWMAPGKAKATALAAENKTLQEELAKLRALFAAGSAPAPVVAPVSVAA